ncbi:MAG: hypothetical protein UY48_C0016G0004 [Candidatus Gottesmanbacteria bacterium GW2011_GWB1_49_7]|uniref:KAP NTPase domain-containing protein n=1 Tax=Candidatus Gottesmanbacteria bacterium GW2011_GWB1_49_7 TaxID=1618448 RepID=A0A0G1Y9H3_9BACT|nr:MAG: hypothetical protein UY48_C0016G0004 [Candidatus Gottesmanbacteria bacterium GW2011_GWB1_49_7]
MIRNSHQIANVIVMGNWGVGKSQFIEELSNMISQERGIRNIFFDSDRYYFEDAVRKDTAGKAPEPDGSIIGLHSVLVEDGPRGRMIFRALDGTIFNEAHREMLYGLSQCTPGVIRTVEYATGPNNSFQQGEELDQSGRFVVKHLVEGKVILQTFVIELEAPFAVRKKRNTTREDPVDAIAFELYGKPGGKITNEDAALLGENFLHVKNHSVPLERSARRVFQEYLQSRLLRDEREQTIEGDNLHRGTPER